MSAGRGAQIHSVDLQILELGARCEGRSNQISDLQILELGARCCEGGMADFRLADSSVGRYKQEK